MLVTLQSLEGLTTSEGVLSISASGLTPEDLEKVSTPVMQWRIKRNY